MEWHYSVDGKERTGPVSEDQLKAQIAAGVITANSLVWNKTLTNWQPAGSTSLFPSGATTDVHTCIITGKVFPTSQMIQTEHGWVSAEGRDTYYQCLRENVPLPVAEGQTNARADGKRIVVPIKGAKLPLRCIKTNAAINAKEVQSKKLYWCNPLVFLALLANILIVLILYYALRKPVPLEIPLSAKGRSIVRKHQFITWGLVLSGAALGIVSVAQRLDGFFSLLLLVGVVTFIAGLVYSSLKGTVLRVVKYKDGEAWLAGACREYVASLPAYR